MWLYMVFLFTGMAVGFSGKMPCGILKRSGSFQLWGLLLILFAMGIGIGSDREIIESFMTVGLHSVILACAAVTGSIIVVRLFRPLLQREKESAM